MHILLKVREDLKQNSDEKTKKSAQNFFKEQIQFYGVKTAVVNKIGKDHFKTIKDFSKEKIFVLCEELWRSGYLEESFIASNWSYYINNKFEPEDFNIFEKWIDQYVNNWASCDTLCNHTIGTFIEMYPAYVSQLKRWTGSNNRWMRRASAVSLIIPARKGKFLDGIFEIADRLLSDEDDLVQRIWMDAQGHQSVSSGGSF